MLIDQSRDVLRAYGVWHKIGLDAINIARPALFIVEPTGAIRYSFVADKQHEFPSYQEIVAVLNAGS